MRRGSIPLAFAMLALGILCVTPSAFAQFPGGKKGFGGGFGGSPFGGGFSGGFGGGGFSGGMMSDPSRMFDMLARGRPYFLISETTRLAGPLSQFAQQKGITNGQITREQFTQFAEQMKANFTGGGSPGGISFGGGNPFGGGAPFAATMSISPGSSSGPPPFMGMGRRDPYEMINRMADDEFRRRDVNGDGYLNLEEMPEAIKNDLAHWDINRDTLIDINEFRAYYLARFSGEGDRQVNPVTIILEDDLDKRPTVLRAGKLPKELKWFEDMDIDKDGQIAMWEWRRAGKDPEEFANYDRNDDGFITPEEALRIMAHNGHGRNSADSEEGGETVVRQANAGPSFMARGPGEIRSGGEEGRGKKKYGDFGNFGGKGKGKKGGFGGSQER